MESQNVTEHCPKLCSSVDEVIDRGKLRDTDVGRTRGDGQEEVMTDSVMFNNQLPGDAKETERKTGVISDDTTDDTENPEAKSGEKQTSVLSETPAYFFAPTKNSTESSSTVSVCNLPNVAKDKLLKTEEQAKEDITNVSERADLLATENISVSLPEDENDTHCSDKDSCSMPSILSLLRVWNDGSPRRLKNLEHATLIIKNLLCEHLPGFAAKETIPDTPECLLILLQDCLSQYQSMNNILKSRQKELELELEESRRTGAERYHVLVEEHKERLSRVFQDHEQQLTAAVERAINSRRQAGSLHAQLALAQAKIEQMETERKENAESIMTEHRKKLNELNEEKLLLLSRIEQLEAQLKIKEAEVKVIEERNRELETKNKTELVQEQEYLKKLEKQLAAEISVTTVLRNELKEERQRNQDLWLETDKKAQELAALQSKLETTHCEIIHKDRLLQMLREEILEKFNADYQESLDHSSLVSDSGMSFTWLSSIKQQISNTSLEIQEKSNMLALKELTLTDVENELKKRQIRIESIKQEQNLTELAFKQLSEELNKKKEQINKLTLHNKKAEKKIVAILEQAAERNKLLQSLKAELEDVDSHIQQITIKMKEENLKMKDLESKVIASEQFNKQLIEKLKNDKKEEDLLKSQFLLKQNHVDHLHKAIESKNKIIVNLEKKLSRKDNQLANFISTTGSTLDTVIVSPIASSDYILSLKEGDDMLSAASNEKNSPCSNLRKDYVDSETKQIIVKSSNVKLGLSPVQPTDQRKPVRVKQPSKYRRRLENYFPSSKPYSGDFEHVSTDTLASPLSSDQLVSRDAFLKNQFASPNGSKLPVKHNVVSQYQGIETNQQLQKDICHTFTHSVSPAKSNSPLTVNINLQPPSIQFQQAHEKSESERMCCNVAIDMKSLYSPLKHKNTESSPFVNQKEKQNFSDKNLTPQFSGYYSVPTTPEYRKESFASATLSTKEPYYPRASTPVSKENARHNSIDTNSGFTTFDSCSSEQEERLPVEGGEQT